MAIARRDGGIVAFVSPGVLDRTVDDLIRNLADDIKAYGVRRLIFDSVLVLICVLPVFVSIRTSRRVLSAARCNLARAEAISRLNRMLHEASDVSSNFDSLCRTLIELFDAVAVIVRTEQGACDANAGVAWQRSDDGVRRLDDVSSQSLVSTLLPGGMEIRIACLPRSANAFGSPWIPPLGPAVESTARGSTDCMPLVHEAGSSSCDSHSRSGRLA